MKKMKQAILLFLISFMVYGYDAQAQVDSVFVSRDYSGEGDGRAMVMDNSGNIYVCGYINNLYIVSKYSPAGELLWKNQSPSPGRAYDFYLGGNTHLYSAGLNYGTTKSVVIKKMNTSGTELWTKTLDSNFNLNPYVNISSDNNGNSIVNYSIIDSNTITTKFITKKCDSNGNVLYTLTRTHPGYKYSKIKTDQLGNTYILYLESFVLDKVSASGNMLWSREFHPADSNYASDFCLDGNSNAYIIGTQLNPNTLKDFVTVKYNANGVFQWDAYYNNDSAVTTNLDEGICITIGSDGFVYSAGNANRSNTYKCLRVIKYNANGEEIWHTNSFTNMIVHVNNILTDSDGNTYVTYTQRGLNGGAIHPAYIRKFDSNGEPVWVEYGYLREYMNDIILDDMGSIYTVGRSKISLDGDLLTVRKYGQDGFSGIINNTTPLNYSLSQNYPNPFNPSTSIRFDIQRPGLVRLTVFDFLGRKIKTIINGSLQPGSYEETFDADGLSSGIYFYRLDAEGFTETRKMILLK